MPSVDIRDKLLIPAGATVIGGLILAGIVTAARSALFWAIVGGVTFGVITTVLVRVLVRLAGQNRALGERLDEATGRLDQLSEGLAREYRALNELNGEVVRVRERGRLAEMITVPEWLRVAINFQLDRGAPVEVFNSAMRFSHPDGREIYTIHFPYVVPEDDIRDELHKRLGITQREYGDTLISPDRAGDAARHDYAQRLADLGTFLDDVNSLLERKGFGRPDQPPAEVD